MSLSSCFTTVLHCIQENQKTQQEVVWQVDRLNKELQQAKAEQQQLQDTIAANSAGRGVMEVDEELETVERDRSAQERARDDLLHKQNRLR